MRDPYEWVNAVSIESNQAKMSHPGLVLPILSPLQSQVPQHA